MPVCGHNARIPRFRLTLFLEAAANGRCWLALVGKRKARQAEMRRLTIGILATGVGLAGCGGGAHFANDPRPPVPVNLSVYINDARVSISPRAVGAGPLIFIITNQASRAQSMAIRRGRSAIADTGPINPQGTAQLTVNASPGNYAVTTSAVAARTQAQRHTVRRTRTAVLHIGPPRPSASNQLQQP